MMWRRRAAALTALGLAALAFGIVAGGAFDGPRQAPRRAVVVQAIAGTSVSSAPAAPAAPVGATTPAAAAPAARVDPEQAAARLLAVGFAGTDATAPVFGTLRDRGWGAILLQPANWVADAQAAALVAELRAAATAAGHPAPLLLAGGALVKAAGARRVGAAGVTLALGPPADLAGPAARHGLAGVPAQAAAALRSAVAQARTAGVAVVPGHFPGEGGASADPAIAPATVGFSMGELEARDLVPFRAVLGRVPAVQLSAALYAAFDGVTPATLLPEAVALLRTMGFRGAVVSADLVSTALATGEDVATVAVRALRAGCDLLAVPGDATDQLAAQRALATAIRRGAVPAARVREALRRLDGLR